MFYFAWTFWIVGNCITAALAGYKRSRRSVRHDVECGLGELSMHRDLLLAMGGNQRVWNK